MIENVKIVSTNKAPAAVGTYSQGVDLGNIVLFSGQIGLNPQTGEMAQGFEGQMRQILNNVDGVLEACDLTRDNIVKTTIFVTDLNNFGIVNSHYEEYFSKPYPARSCVEVPRLPKDAVVEIEVIAARN